MKTFFDYVLERFPWVVRWTFYVMAGMVSLLGGAFTMGWQAVPVVESYVDDRVNKIINPMKTMRDQQISNIESDIREIKTDMRDIRNSLIGPRRSEK
jgi:hypothetical protein